MLSRDDINAIYEIDSRTKCNVFYHMVKIVMVRLRVVMVRVLE